MDFNREFYKYNKCIDNFATFFHSLNVVFLLILLFVTFGHYTTTSPLCMCEYFFVFVWKDEQDLNSLSTEFLTYIGGQAHIQCARHKMPLITSTERKLKCSCGRIKFFCCCSLHFEECSVMFFRPFPSGILGR